MPSAEFLKLEKKVWGNKPTRVLSVDEFRDVWIRSSSGLKVPEDVACEPVKADGVPCEWISAPQAPAGKALLYLHGGGYVGGSVDTHRELISRISRAGGLRALAVDYRLAPEHPFPAALEDALTAYRWLIGQGHDPRAIAVAGDSAGGGLTLALLGALKKAQEPLPAGAVMLSPWADLTLSGVSIKANADIDCMVDEEELKAHRSRYIGDGDPTQPEVSPVFGDPGGFPPLLFQTGTAEVLLDDTIRVAERARAAGVDVTLELGEGMMHMWQRFAPMIPEGRESIDSIGSFLRAHV